MASSLPLFRKEALEAKGVQVAGRILVRSPALLHHSSLAALACLVMTGLFLCLGHYSPRETVPGSLVAERGVVKVVPTRPGKVEFVHVKEGEYVGVGHPLALISVEQGWLDSRGRSAISEIVSMLDEEIGRLQGAVYGEAAASRAATSRATNKITALAAEVEALEAEKETVRRQLESSESILERLGRLNEAGYVTDLEMLSRRQQALELRRQTHVLDKSLISSRNQLADARVELEQQPAQSKQRRIELQNRIAELQRRITSAEIDRGYSIVAPIAGKVSGLKAEVGRAVSISEPLLTIVAPDAPLVAQLLVPSRAAGFLRPGQEVRLRYKAFPYEQFGVHTSRIRDISGAALRPDEIVVGVPIHEPVYRVVAVLDQTTVSARGHEQMLRPGMLFDADIILERRPLWAWLLQPLMAVRGRI